MFHTLGQWIRWICDDCPPLQTASEITPDLMVWPSTKKVSKRSLLGTLLGTGLFLGKLTLFNIIESFLKFACRRRPASLVVHFLGFKISMTLARLSVVEVIPLLHFVVYSVELLCSKSHMSLKQPVTQVRLTNIAVVRLKRRGKRFELACYKNKVVSWRQGNEKDLDDVLQTTSIFSNVSKGVLAKTKDLKDAFKTDDTQEIVLEILRKGELQVSERERQYHTDNLFNEIAVLVSEKCVDPNTNRPFSVGVIERAMKDTLHYAVLPNKSAKVQAQTVIKELQKYMPISRAQMRLQLSIPVSRAKAVKEKLKPHVKTWEQEEWEPDYEGTVLIDPGSFRVIDDVLREETKGQGTFDVLSMAVVEDNDEQLT